MPGHGIVKNFVPQAFDAARAAQTGWAAEPVARRLAVIARFRRAVAADPWRLVGSVPPPRDPAETLAAEILPLLAAARFLERRAARLLAPRRPPGAAPAWLFGVRAEIRREPLGVVLILAPSNYPLMLPGIQALQALAAGNAVGLKPAPGCAAAAEAFAAALAAAGLPRGLLAVLGEEDGAAAVEAGADKIVLTGSAATGARVLAAAAARLTPATMELSGCDAVFVLPGADLALAADCIAYGLRLNGGATCIAPRRVFVARSLAAALEAALLRRLASAPGTRLPPAVRGLADAVLAEADAAGARALGPRGDAFGPVLVADANADMRLAREDVFAPVAALIAVEDMEDALAQAARCRYALGASIFGPPDAARALAGRVRAGSVTINDIIVPTADPRLPFGGRGASGFGVTRGAEGLLEMTALKAISIRRHGPRPHLRPADPGQLATLLALLYGDADVRWAALRGLARRGQAPLRS